MSPAIYNAYIGDIVQPNHHTHQLHVLCDNLLRIWPSIRPSCAILDISSHDHEIF